MMEWIEFAVWILLGLLFGKIFNFSGLLDVLLWPITVFIKLYNGDHGGGR